ncbi:MAG: hypothetical protein DMF87_06110 [Acidobacteria bacterium]|nr:MAG: hypothetical protein DMF87_06110 [Acidobacteriota bacterium]
MMKTDAVSGQSACDLLADPAFTASWQALYEQCPWATPFQCPAFVTAWYQIYARQFAPLIVRGRAADGSLAGLFTLAVDVEAQTIQAAGADRAEYQAWLAREDSASEFIRSALQHVCSAHPGRPIDFYYLPPGIPTAWIAEDPQWKRRCRLHSFAAPIMDVADGAQASASRRRKTHRSLGRLQRSGHVRFEELRTVDELAAVIDSIAAQYDFRQAAVNGYVHFGRDERRKQFQLALMRTPGLLHATVLRHGDAVVAANLGLKGKDRVYLGIFSNAAAYAKESPGKLHLVMLGDHLAHTGQRQLDLTPGEDAYKPAFASRYEQVHRLTVYPNARQWFRAGMRHAMTPVATRALAAIGIDARAARTRLARARRGSVRHIGARVRAALTTVRRRVWSHDEIRVYAMPVNRVGGPPPGLELRHDALDDLLLFEPMPGASQRQEFLACALARVGNGHHFHTFTDGGTLIYQGWMAENQARAMLIEVGQEVTLPPRSSVLYDAYTHPAARGRGIYKQSLRCVLHAVASRGASDWIFIWVEAGNTASRHVIEDAGFEYYGSAFQRTVLGWVKRWSTCEAFTVRTDRGAALAVPAGGDAL